MLAREKVDLLDPGLSSARDPRDSDRLRSELLAPMLERLEEELLRLEEDPRILLAPKLTSFLST